MPTRNAEIIAAILVGFTTCSACIATSVVVEIILARALRIMVELRQFPSGCFAIRRALQRIYCGWGGDSSVSSTSVGASG